MANEVTLPETRVTEPSVITTHNTRPESQVNVAKPQVQLNPNTALKPLQVGGNEMAEVDTTMLAAQHSDIRREAVEHTNEIIKEGLKEAYETQGAVKDARRDLIDVTNVQTGTILDRFFAVGRDTSDLRAQVSGLGYQVRDGFAAAAKDSEINGLKTQVEIAKQTTYLSDKIDGGHQRIADIVGKIQDDNLNRWLIERNAELVEERGHARHWRGNYDHSQFQALASQMQNFQSQLAETRQGMVNFGTMAGVGQTSTANNVR